MNLMLLLQIFQLFHHFFDDLIRIKIQLFLNIPILLHCFRIAVMNCLYRQRTYRSGTADSLRLPGFHRLLPVFQIKQSLLLHLNLLLDFRHLIQPALCHLLHVFQFPVKQFLHLRFRPLSGCPENQHQERIHCQHDYRYNQPFQTHMIPPKKHCIM